MPFPADRRFIDRAEAELGAKLPDFLAQRLMRDNGGEFASGGDVWMIYPVFDDADRKRIARTCNHLLRETKSAREWRGFPQDAIAIAHNGSGDKLVLFQNGPRFGDSVFLWDHETAEIHAFEADFGP